jgi:hypothetical protein
VAEAAGCFGWFGCCCQWRLFGFDCQFSVIGCPVSTKEATKQWRQWNWERQPGNGQWHKLKWKIPNWNRRMSNILFKQSGSN